MEAGARRRYEDLRLKGKLKGIKLPAYEELAPDAAPLSPDQEKLVEKMMKEAQERKREEKNQRGR